ncbi:unnamed protein product [Danaus chrysippus]|uniref:(African queen) hypothetical protein n=1 Tax=Danaus chrysippus TaxID=151541 RepID=A0A8J2QUQ4_9NEOP|nr:unnamed protein product [Danaus chrysippus]
MSIIGVRGIPPKLSLEQFIRKLAHVLHGQFEAFSVNNKTKSKTFYLKLSHRLETRSTIQLINRTRFPFQLQAFLPDNDMNLQVPQKTKKIPNTLRKALNIPLNFTPEENIYEKLEKIQTEKQFPTCYCLSKCYRDEFPHKTDVQLIKDIYKNYQLEMGLPEMELNETEFYDYKVECDGEDSVSLNKAKNLSQKYSNKIINKIMDHINNYDFDNHKHPSTTIEVRKHIKNLSPLIPNIVKSIIKEKFENQGKETFSVVRFSIKQVNSLLRPVLKGQFRVLNFDPKVKKPKTCYVYLSENLDPQMVSKTVRTLRIGPYKLYAYQPPDIPYLKLRKSANNVINTLNNTNVKPRFTPKVLPVVRKPFKPTKQIKQVNVDKGVTVRKTQPIYSAEMVIKYTHEQIMLEMQSKYPGLYDLNKKLDNKLLVAVGQTVHKRLKEIADHENSVTCMGLSRTYRRIFLHSGDFQLISTTLYRIQDVMGMKRLQLLEKDLIAPVIKPYDFDKISPEQLQASSSKYSDEIVKAVLDHVGKLSTKIDPSKDPVEDEARIKVTEQLKNMLPYLPDLVKGVISKHLIPQKSIYYVVKIYGEPCLPPRRLITAWMPRYKMFSAVRSERMFNLMLARVPAAEMTAVLAADGTIMGE